MSDIRFGLAVHEAVAACLAEPSSGAVSAGCVASMLSRFADFVEARGVVSLDAVSPPLVSEFVEARLRSGEIPSVSTRRNRRSAVRLLYRLARAQALAVSDPTLDVAVPRREAEGTRPLTDGELERCRDVAWWMSSRVAALWALAETSCRGGELAAIRAADVAVVQGRVQLPGTPRVAARVGELTKWGIGAVERQLLVVPDGPLVYSGSGSSNAGQVSTCRALGSVLLRAGLGGDGRVRPASIAGWAGRRVFDRSGRIEDAARVLGVRSLDSAARMIGLDWTGDA